MINTAFSNSLNGLRLFSSVRYFGSMKKKISSHTASWVFRQVNDKYTQLAQQNDYRSRAAYKLKQMDDKYSILRKNQCVVELGCYPGGWAQVVVERCMPDSSNSMLIGVDKHKIDPVYNYVSLQGEVGQPETMARLLGELGERRADVVLSDMAPSVTGIKQSDSLSSVELAIRAGEVCEAIMKPGGTLVVKFFMGPAQANLKTYLSSHFEKVTACKPKSSRSDSPEMFYVCTQFKGRSKMAAETFHDANSFQKMRKLEGSITNSNVSQLSNDVVVTK